MIDEDAEAARLLHVEPVPEDAEPPAWSGVYFDAWHALRDDRFYGAMGGLGRIYYTAISRYAADHGITGESFGTFVRLLSVMDDEYLIIMAERRADEEAKRKRD